MIINKYTKKCISIAEKPGTFGVEFHNKGYESLGLNYLYIPVKVLPYQLESTIQLVRDNFHGCSVSMPHKLEVIKYLDELDDSAKKVDAVNTILNNCGKLIGYNTDYYGAEKAIKSKVEIKGKDIIMAGSGGVARAIACAVNDLGGRLKISNRTEKKAIDLSRMLEAQFIPYDDLNNTDGYMFINATSMGMNSDEAIISDERISSHDIIMDVVVGQTKLIKKAKRRNKILIYGLEMTLYQAEKQFEIYTNRKLPDDFFKSELEELKNGTK